MIYESTRKMTPDEQMAFDMGYAKAKEEYADALAKAEKRAKVAEVQLEEYRRVARNRTEDADHWKSACNREKARAEAAIETIKRSKPCEHCTHFADGKYCTNCDDQCSNFKWRDPTEQEEST